MAFLCYHSCVLRETLLGDHKGEENKEKKIFSQSVLFVPTALVTCLNRSLCGWNLVKLLMFFCISDLSPTCETVLESCLGSTAVLRGYCHKWLMCVPNMVLSGVSTET